MSQGDDQMKQRTKRAYHGRVCMVMRSTGLFHIWVMHSTWRPGKIEDFEDVIDLMELEMNLIVSCGCRIFVGFLFS